ncbi:porin, partial [Acidovorax sp. CCYZU-2555]|uniref:porin n=1 Tax=Acidovorax sp. CCYZU-2555 TaxID=2835042 RepID=UPI001BCFFF9C|nr:porin [Acidovorax sp. CCYZU-2555]
MRNQNRPVRLLTFAGLSLAACMGGSAANAQSKVELWGIVDSWAGIQKTRSGATPSTVGVVESGGGQASRWGVRGTEDLGGGLKIQFALEQGLMLDTGSVSNTSNSNNGFNRNSYLRLSGGFGELRLGRMLTAYDQMRGSMNQLYDSSGFASTLQTWSAGATAGNGLPAVAGSDYLARTNNTILYGTPAFHDVSATLSYSPGEGAVTATSAPRSLTTNLRYDDKTMRVGYSFQKENYTTGANIFHLISGSYRFSSLRVVGSIQRQKDERVVLGQTSDEYQFGVDIPWGAATLALGLAGAKTRNGEDRVVVDARGYSALATYDLSKRTRLYAAARQLKVQRADASTSLDVLRVGAGIT